VRKSRYTPAAIAAHASFVTIRIEVNHPEINFFT
jgi:hypothetical protein